MNGIDQNEAPLLLSTGEVADLLHWSRAKVRRWAERRLLPGGAVYGSHFSTALS
jgi:DNA-binding transcriptional regulator YiaG